MRKWTLRPTCGAHAARRLVECYSGLRPAYTVLVLALSVGLLWSKTLSAQPALVQTIGAQAVQTNLLTLTLPSPPTSGNLLVAVCGTAIAQTIDSVSPGWFVAIDQSAGSPGQAILYRVADSSAAAGFTIRYAAATRMAVHLYEYSGMDTVTPLGAVASSSGSSNSAATGTLTTIVAGELVVAGLVVASADPVSGWTGGFVERHNFLNSQPPKAPATYLGADLVAASPGSYGTSVTFGGKKAKWIGQAASFKPAPAISVVVTNANLAFGTEPVNTWLSPQSTVIINDGRVVEDFACRVSPFTDGANVWSVDPAANGPDRIRAEWSTSGPSGPWSAVSGYDTDFPVATGIPAGDSVTFWLRIQTPLTTSSYLPHASAVTVTAQAN